MGGSGRRRRSSSWGTSKGGPARPPSRGITAFAGGTGVLRRSRQGQDGAIVSSKIAGDRFTIRTDKPGVEVSWQVTGIRKDAYAEAHRIPVEEAKPPPERGTFLHPAEHGRPESDGVEAARDNGLAQRGRQRPAAPPAELGPE